MHVRAIIEPPQRVARPAGAARSARLGPQAADVLRLQRAAGNRAVASLILLQRALADPAVEVYVRALARSRRILSSVNDEAARLIATVLNKDYIAPISLRDHRRYTKHMKRGLQDVLDARPRPADVELAQATALRDRILELEDEIHHLEISRDRAAGAGTAAERLKKTTAKPADLEAKAKAPSSPTRSTPPTGASTTKVGEEAADIGAKLGRVGEVGARAAERVAKIGVSLLLPGPDDVIFMMWEFLNGMREAREKLRRDALRTGFALGLSASLLGMDAAWVAQKLIDRRAATELGPELVGGRAIKERANNDGVLRGFAFANKLDSSQRKVFLSAGMDALRDKRRTFTEAELFSLDGVIALTVALLPSVDHLFAEARKSEEIRRRAEAARDRRESREVGNKV